MLLRPARRDDLDAVVLLLRAQLDEHAIPVPETIEGTVAATFDDPRRATVLVAQRDERDGAPDAIGAIVGVAYMSFTWTLDQGGAVCWLEELYVTPASRGRGVGDALLREAIAEAARRGCVAVDLEVEEGHERVESLYRRHGFRAYRRTHWTKSLRS